MSSDDRAASVRSQTRGFLFADLRGYSAFTERHGDQAARELLARYRSAVRRVIGSFDGAEIRTEGDSFYVVFDSVAQAVRAGLAILAAVAEPAAGSAAHPVQVGIGIHAGEAEDSEEGIVSSAVNVAARICAKAEPGELLVSDTVRALTRSYLAVGFVPRGRRRLKGIAEPVAMYRVVAGRAAAVGAGPHPVRSALSRRWLQQAGVAAAVAVAVLTVAIIGGTMLREGLAREDYGASAGPHTSLTIAAASPDGSAIETGAAFPTEAEGELLGAIDAAVRDRCVRAAEGPIYLSGAGRAFDEPLYPVPVAYVASIDCDLGGISAPDRVQYWRLPPGGSVDPLAPDSVTPNVILHQRAGTNAATDSACSAGAPALEEWSFGRTGGKLVCYVTATGDAVLWWTYDDTDIIATAVRDDRDLAALLEWWTANARFAP